MKSVDPTAVPSDTRVNEESNEAELVLVEDEFLVEGVSIDGMCGVY